MDNNDRQIGRILSRREVLSLIGATGAALLVGCGAADTGSTRASGAAGSARDCYALSARAWYA